MPSLACQSCSTGKKARTVSTTGTPQKKRAEKQQYTAKEQNFIKTRERLEGRKLTQQEINFSLVQLGDALDLVKRLRVWKEEKAPARA